MFDWKDFINLSHQLINSFSTQYEEALYRTIVSRSYYGIYKQVEDKLRDLEGRGNIILPYEDSEGRRLGSHERIIFYLQNHNDERIRDFGELLEDLKRQRHKSDYNAQGRISRRNSETALRLASRLSNEWEELINFIG